MDRLLRLSPDERGTVALASATAFLSAAGLTIAASSIDALVFSRYGVDRLPTLYLLLGGTMFVASLGVSALLGRLGRGRSFLAIPIAIGLLAAAARIALLSDVSWIYPVLWILRGAAEFLLGLAVWGLAGLVTDTRQAKRFFPLIGGAGVLGQVLGGLSTRPLAGWVGIDNLILVWMGALAAVVVLGRLLVVRADGGRPPVRRRSGHGLSDLREGLRDVRRSRLLRWMSLGSILFSTLFFSLYLPFSRAATARYPAPADLAGFLGFFFAASTALTLVLSLLVMNRLLSRLGIPVVMLVLPVLYLVAFGTLTLTSSFAVLLVFRFAQVVWLQGGASSAWEAVINTVPPERRDRMRAFLYGGPTQVGTVLAGIVAMVGEGAVSPRVLYGIGLVAAGAAVLAMWRVRQAYGAELVHALREGRPHVFGATSGHGEPFGANRADRAAVAVAVEALSDPAAGVRRVAAELLGDLEATEATAALVGALHDGDAEVRATALRSLVRSGRSDPSEEIPELLLDPSPEVRLEAVAALGRFRADWQRARALLRDPDGLVRTAAARLLLERGDEDPDIDDVLARLARSPHADARAAALGALGASPSAHALDAARAGLSDPAPSVRIEAVRAMRRLDPTADPSDLVDAIVGGGSLLLEAATELSSADPAVEEAARRLAAGSTERARARRLLADSIEPDGDERLVMLRDSLLAASGRDALTAIRSVALLTEPGAIGAAIESLSADDPADRANAIEVIETLGNHELVRPLLALWERRDRAAGPYDDWLAHAVRDPDEWIRACAAWATGARTDPQDDLEDDGGRTMTESLATMPLMERVLFLRRVPLFTELPPQDLKPIASIATEGSYADADTIAEQGDPGDEMHIIIAGYVMVIVREPGGHQEVIAVRSEGDVIGEMAVITSSPRMASLAAKGPVRLLTIARRQFEAVLRERPETSLALMRVLCQRLVDRGDRAPG